MNRISTVPGEDRIYHLLPVTVTFHKSTTANRLQLMPAALLKQGFRLALIAEVILS